jgi:CheY-like chemotaxis protein
VIRLPLSAARTPRALPAGRRPPVAARDRVRVLLVDDNRDAAEMLAESLRALGHAVQVAHDGPQALEIASREVPDVALLDIGLPVIDGYEVLARLRALPSWKDVRTIALTGYGLQNDRDRTKEAGFDEHLVKPVDVAEVDAKLRLLRTSSQAGRLDQDSGSPPV